MKTLKYIMVPALTGLMFVACNNEPKGPTQAELDTQVEAKVKSATDQLKADCDNRIHQAAQREADSILAKAAMATPAKPAAAPPKEKAKSTSKATTTPPPPPPPPNGGKNTNESGVNRGKNGAPAPDGKAPVQGQNMGKKK